MEQIETQASDLHYLTQVPIAPSDAGSLSYATPRPGGHGSPAGSAGYGDNSACGDIGLDLGVGAGAGAADGGADDSVSGAAAHKRKSMDDAAARRQTRSKRNRYISLACNECKRRKIKCNGETPCQRCGNLNLECLYTPNCCSSSFKDSDEFKSVTTQLSRLQEEVQRLNQTIKSIQADSARLVAPSTERTTTNGMSPCAVAPLPAQSSGSASMTRHEMPHSRGGPFRGPTSMAFSLDVANNTITNIGYRGMEEPDNHHHHDQDAQEGCDVALQMPSGSHGRDPLLEFSNDEIIRLCRFHEDEIGIMYPVLDIHQVITHVSTSAPYLESVRQQQHSEVMNDDMTLQLKMVMCCALVVESHGHSDKARRLYESMEAVINRKLMSDASDVTNLPLLCLLAGYRFLSNDEVLSWRVIGQVMRLCLEAGLHQKRGLMKIQNDSERRNALNSFWSAYVLDRRWAFGTGLPFAVQDDEIDPGLPLPEEYPFLVSMITYSRIGGKVWRQVSCYGPILARELRQEVIEALDAEILQWYETIPDEVRIQNWDKEKQMSLTPSYNLQRLRIWTYLRLNQIRIWLYTPILRSATSIMQHPVQAQRVVDLAKDTIQYLNRTTRLYRRAQVFNNQFLASVIAVVFLASVHAPVRFSAVCREEFYMALDLVKDLSAKSWVSKRLWRAIKSLKDAAPRFGLDPDDEAHSKAAMGMMGLAGGAHTNHVEGGGSRSVSVGHANSPFVLPGPGQGEHHDGAAAAEQLVDGNGTKIQSELSRIFEGYVGLNGFQFGDGGVLAQAPAQGGVVSESGAGAYTPALDGTVFAHFWEMF